MSYYQGGSRQGGDLYRPRRTNGQNGNSSQYTGSSQYGGSGQYGSSYNNNYQLHSQGFDRGSRYQPQGNRLYGSTRNTDGRASKDAYQQVYSQSYAENQLWMGDLDQLWTEASITDLWKQMGDAPTGVKIIRDKMGNLQYCFVTFSSPKDVANAIKNKGRQVPGSNRYFKLNWASGSTQGDSKYSSYSSRQGGHNGASRQHSASKSQQDYSIFVGDLGSDVTEALLFAHFDKEYTGLVKQVKIMTDPNTGVNKGFGFVRFISLEAQQAALQDTKSIIINNRKIRVGQANGSGQEPVSASKKGLADLSVSSTVHINQQQPALSPFTDPHNTVIVVKGISANITDEDLVSHFLVFGHIIFCRANHITNTAHIKFYSRQAAERALVFMHGFAINGCRLALRWGREEETTSGIVKWKPSKGSKYVSAKTSPPLYGELPHNVLFSKLNQEDLKDLKFVEQSNFLTVEQINSADELAKMNRKNYLELAF